MVVHEIPWSVRRGFAGKRDVLASMCGVVGYWWPGQQPDGFLASRMAASIRSRGPDAEGVWLSERDGVALAHRRLSIVDLTRAGAQPMRSPDGERIIVFNGEIYNHRVLRRKLEREGRAPPWRGQSDTETLLAACGAWGLDRALEESVGMFALALWDARERTLTLARDRVGEKPLYFGWQGRCFLFGSELKALKPHPSWEGDVSVAALGLYLRHNYVPGPYSVYRGIHKLPPGTTLTLRTAEHPDQVQRECLAVLEQLPTWDGVRPLSTRTVRFGAYWSLSEVAARGAVNPTIGGEEDTIDQLEKLLKEAIALQMVADVPLGAFLSGGIDSSTVVALIQAQSSRPVRTFSIGFREAEYNEAEFARTVAAHLGTQHTDLYVSFEDALDVIPQLPQIYDEPFADSSQIPTHLVAKLAREHVTVSLSGDGGDELFSGYPRYEAGARIWKHLECIPGPVLKVASRCLAKLPTMHTNRLGALFPGRLRQPHLGERLQHLARLGRSTNHDDLYQELLTHWHTPPVIHPEAAVTSIRRTAQKGPASFDSRMMYFDTLGYLPDDVLVKVDRAAMAVGLETRVPLLDHRVVEFAWRVPADLKVRHGDRKWLLRQVLYRHVPRELVDRPKMGFGVPIDRWLRGPLRDWAEELLSVRNLSSGCLLEVAPIREKWKEHLSGRRDWHNLLWDVLMWQAWHAHAK